MKTGRNELCFCGSGKKYKKCCLGKTGNIPKITIPSNLKPNPKLWALMHVNGRNPAKCKCDDCADKSRCPRDSTPKDCSETSLMGEPEFF